MSESLPVQSRRPWRHADLFEMRVPGDPQLSPDGRTVVYTVTRANAATDLYESSLWSSPAEAGAARRLTNGPGDSCPRWSPDGSTLAFLREGEGQGGGLWLLSLGGGEPRLLADRPAPAGEPVWSPDGRQVAFVAMVRDDAGEGADNGAQDPVHLRRLDQKVDGVGVVHRMSRQLFVVDVASGRTRRLTWGPGSVWSPVWSPDGQEIAFAADREEDSDLAPGSVVHVVSADGNRLRQVTPSGEVHQPVDWRDGRLLVVGQRTRGVVLERLGVLDPAAGSPQSPRVLASGLDRNVAVGAPGYPGAVPCIDGDRALFCATDEGAVRIFAADLAGAPGAEVVVGGDVVVAGFSAAGGRLAWVAGTADSPGEVLVDGQRITDLFARHLPDLELARPVPQRWTAPDGTPLHGWILRDDSVPGPQPLLLDVHGGPHNCFAPTFDAARLHHQEMVARGWTVALVNQRGSDGYGEAFMQAVSGDWGLADEGDFLAVVDDLVGRGLVDPERLAVSGYSYGGYMACWLTARTDRFRVAAAGGVVTDLRSMFASSDDGIHMAAHEFGGPPYADPEGYAARSPLTYVRAVTAPTLLLHGEADHRCPIAQAEQWYTALTARGVPTGLVRYPGGSHLLVLGPRPSQRIDYARRVVDWVTRWTAEPTASLRRRSLAERMAGYRDRLDDLAGEHGVPGAVLAVLDGEEVHELATGTANVDTGVPVTPRTLFQIGSNTKLYTATMVMRLVDDGLVALDDLVARHLPELKLPDPTVLEELTVRHLLSHTGGLTGDHFGPVTDWGDDAVERYVASLVEVEQLHPVGAFHSYCNAGWNVLGRLVEVVTGQPYADALRTLVTDPLGVRTPLVRPNDILLTSAAVGHRVVDGVARVASTYQLLPSCVAAGSTPAATAADVVAFLRMHLGGGRAADGTRVLSPESAAAMQEQVAPVVTPLGGVEGYGLGWRVGSLAGERWIGHGGGTIGGISTLEVLPERGLAVVLLTNSGGGNAMGDIVLHELFRDLAGVHVPLPGDGLVEAPGRTVDLHRYAGTYAHGSGRAVVRAAAGGGLEIHLTEPSVGADLDGPPTTSPLVPYERDDMFELDGTPVRFLEPDEQGRCAYLDLERLFRRLPQPQVS